MKNKLFIAISFLALTSECHAVRISATFDKYPTGFDEKFYVFLPHDGGSLSAKAEPDNKRIAIAPDAWFREGDTISYGISRAEYIRDPNYQSSTCNGKVKLFNDKGQPLIAVKLLFKYDRPSKENPPWFTCMLSLGYPE